MRLLVLGGTVFLGRAIVEAALGRGHAVTLFNRGRTNPGLFPGVERLRGDRDGDLRPLAGRTWDAAIDTCGSVPRVVRASAELLAGAVDTYSFVSTIGVYRDFREQPDEDSPLAVLAEETERTPRGRRTGRSRPCASRPCRSSSGSGRSSSGRG